MNKEIYNERLLFFADFLKGEETPRDAELLSEVELVAVEHKVRIHYKVKYRQWIFEVLPGAFDQWYFDEFSGDPLYEGCDTEAGTVAAVIDFFGLSQDEFCHCFDIEGFQLCDRFGGVKLNIDSSQGNEIAHNIVELVKRRRQPE